MLSNGEHRKIVQAIVSGDGVTAETLVIEHLGSTLALWLGLGLGIDANLDRVPSNRGRVAREASKPRAPLASQARGSDAVNRLRRQIPDDGS